MRHVSAPLLLLIVILPFIASCDSPAPETPAQIGISDWYSIASGMTLSRPAPGVLANDRAAGEGLIARLVSEARYGSVDLGEDGSFTYAPTYKFSGLDSFSYQVVDGDFVSEPVLVRITFPNVVVILVDDLGQGDLKSYNSRAVTDTPNLAALADAGIRFSHSHSTAAVCSPSRYSVLTGNYPHRGRLSSGVWSTYEPSTMIIPGQETLGNIFDEAGYRTGFIGKVHNGAAFWNVAGNDYTKDHRDIDFTRPFDRGPTQFGFDYSFLLPGGVSSLQYAYYENDQLVRFDEVSGEYKTFSSNDEAHRHFIYLENWRETHNGGLTGAPGWVVNDYDSRQAGRILTRKALEFLSETVDENKSSTAPRPFFLFFATPQLHTPYSPPEYFDITLANDLDSAADGFPVEGSSGFSLRADMIHEVDLMTGAIVDFLAERGQLENTLIVFTSDNGPLRPPIEAEVNPQGSDGAIPLRGYKGLVYEGGHRVPLLARWGDGEASQSAIAPGTQSSELLGLHDLAATFYSLLSRQRPFNQANDSKSFLPVLLGTQPDNIPVRDHMIIQGSPKSAADNKNYIDRAFYKRDSDGDLWKLTVISNNADPVSELSWKELYNLSDDPGESSDLIDDPAAEALLQQMQSEYLQLIVQPQTIISYR